MSIRQLSWAFEAEVDHPMKRWLLVCIAELLYPNTSDLIELSRMKRSTVYEILGKLVNDNLVIKTEHNRYLLNTESVCVMDNTTYEQFQELDSEVCAETGEKEGELVRESDLEDNTIINTNYNNYNNNNTNYNNYNNNTIEPEKTQNLEVFEETLSQDWRWKPFTSERSRRDWIERKKSLAEKYGIHLNDLAEALVEYLARPEYQDDPKKIIKSTFTNWLDRRVNQIRGQQPQSTTTGISNADRYSQKLAERGDN